MITFQDLPRELRDAVYEFAALGEQSILVLTRDNAQRLVISGQTAPLLLASKQTHAEYSEVLVNGAAVVLSYSRSQKSAGGPTQIVPALAYRTETVTAIVDLDGLKPATWEPKKEHSAIGSELEDAVSQLEKAFGAFPNLKSVEIQWWSDLSVASDRKGIGEWTNALITDGLIRTPELWYGYLGGKLSKPIELRKHLLAHLSLRGRRPSRIARNGRFELIPKGDTAPAKALSYPVTPMSFF